MITSNIGSHEIYDELDSAPQRMPQHNLQKRRLNQVGSLLLPVGNSALHIGGQHMHISEIPDLTERPLGAQKRTRISTTLRPPAPVVGASANSAIRAINASAREAPAKAPVRPLPVPRSRCRISPNGGRVHMRPADRYAPRPAGAEWIAIAFKGRGVCSHPVRRIRS